MISLFKLVLSISKEIGMSEQQANEQDARKRQEAEEKARQEAKERADAEEAARQEEAEKAEELKKELADMKASNKDGKALLPNPWQKYAPTWLGGWSFEKIQAVYKANAAANHYEYPNWWQRRMPTWLGGWPKEGVIAYQQHYRQKYGRPMRPNLWERFMPTELGGASYQEIEAYDQFHARQEYLSFKPNKPTIWDRFAPEVLGGMSKDELAEADMLMKKWEGNNAERKEILKGVTVGELKDRGFTDKQIEELQARVQELRMAQVQKQADGNTLGIRDLTLQTSVHLKDLNLTTEQQRSIVEATKTDERSLKSQLKEAEHPQSNEQGPLAQNNHSHTR